MRRHPQVHRIAVGVGVENESAGAAGGGLGGACSTRRELGAGEADEADGYSGHGKPAFRTMGSQRGWGAEAGAPCRRVMIGEFRARN